MKILISGASGLVGTALTSALGANGHSIARLVRPGGNQRASDVQWDPAKGTIDVNSIEGLDAVIHLSGESIAGGRWSPERKQLLRSSRLDSTRVLVNALSRLRQKPRTFISASAIGIYGNRRDEILTESSSLGADFLAQLARDWEAEAMHAEHAGMRAVALRFGIILSAKGGALPQMLTPFKMGVGGRLGAGKQWMSWIALEDVVGIVRMTITNQEISGAVNVVAPNPVQNAEFTRVLARVLHRPAIFPAPGFALRLMLGEMADALLLSSQRVCPERVTQAGYAFEFETLEPALQKILDTKA